MAVKMIKGIAILGSTGSIGRNTLEVIRKNPDRFRVVSLAAGANIKLLKEQIDEFKPEFVSVLTESVLKDLRKDSPFLCRSGFGLEGAVEAASHPAAAMTVSAIAGAAGLLPTMAAIKAGKDIALANKETLVMAGPLVMEEACKKGVKLLPVDSEHSAIFQSLSGHRKEDVRRIILTASGGPFLNTPYERLETVTPDEALRHPNWSMGRKITIDSATLVNKGLEVIEARWLFDLPASKISVSIHPQSIVHSMVEYTDGSIIAQLGPPDMKGPIAYALSYPERISGGAQTLGMAGLRLEFMEPDLIRFPCLGLSYEALAMGGTAPAVLNAADEVAVGMFLEGRLPFNAIFKVISDVLEKHSPVKVTALEDVIEADRWARDAAHVTMRCFG